MITLGASSEFSFGKLHLTSVLHLIIFDKMEMSKKIMMGLLIFNILVVISSILFWDKLGIDIVIIFNYIGIVFIDIILISSYIDYQKLHRTKKS